jgi:hypothetical protein
MKRDEGVDWQKRSNLSMNFIIECSLCSHST